MAFNIVVILIILITFLYSMGVYFYVSTHSSEKMKLKHNEKYFPIYLKVYVGLMGICFWSLLIGLLYNLIF